jgi:photosystem II stability/assembly factor-like uncharacterized protein
MAHTMTIRRLVGSRRRPLGSGLLAGMLTLVGVRMLSAQRVEVRDDPAAREEYLVRQRAYPFDRIPPNALRNARVQALRNLIPGGSGPRRSSTIASAWASIGPAAIATTPVNAGRIAAIAMGPAGSSTIYVGAAQGGVWKTTNGGTSWAPLTDAQCSLAIGAITLDPVDANIVYVGTGEPNFSSDSYYGCGVLRSTDGGATWANLESSAFVSATGGARVSQIVVDPRGAGTPAGTTLYAATSFGLYKSVTGGAAWTRVLNLGHVSALVMDPASSDVLYAAVGIPSFTTNSGVYRSSDAGVTWTRLGNGLPTADVGRIALAISPLATRAIYAAIEAPSTGDLLGIYRSADGGSSWTSMGARGTSCSTQCWYNMALTADPTDSNRLYFSGLSLSRSNDRGANFTDIGGAIHVDHHAFAFDPASPTTIVAGSDGGIYRSGDLGATWTSLNANLAITQFYAGVSTHPTNAFPILGGTQDNGTLEFRGDVAWPAVFGADGGYTATNFNTPTITFAETQWQPGSGFSGPRRQDTPGRGYVLRTNGIGLNDPALFIPPLVMSPTVPTTLYFGTNRLFRTRNSGGLWAAISPALGKTTGRVSAIAPSASDSLTVYVGTSDGNVQVTSDGGATWTAIISGVPNRYISDIVVDAAHPEIAYLTVSGFSSKHVMKTVNRGATWTQQDQNLPDVPVNALARIPGGDLFVGTDLGVFQSTDDGRTWSRPASGLPNVAVFDLVFHRSTNALLAATHGRSMFSLSVVPDAPPTQLIVDARPAVMQTGQVVTSPIVVSVHETAGYLAPGATNAVTVSIAAGGGTLAGTTTVNAVNGVATFSDLRFGGAAGAQTLSFTSAGLTGATTTVTTIPPVTLALSTSSRREEFPAGTSTPHADSAAVAITGEGAPTSVWTATKTKAWTGFTTSGGTNSGTLRWTRNPAGLPTGTYVDTIIVTVAGATGSPALLIDTLVVKAPAAFAYFLPDTISGLSADHDALDLVADVTSLGDLSIGSYAVSVTWDSLVVRLDSIRAAPAGFAAPAVNVVNPGDVRLASASSAGMSGQVRLARLYFKFAGDGATLRSAILPTFSELSSTTAVNLLPPMSVRAATAVATGGVLRGDVNRDGKVTASDAQAVLQAVVALALPAGFRAIPNGDANCNGALQAVDAQIILSYVVGLPVGQFCVGTVR